MEKIRFILYASLALVGVSLWNAWQIDYPKKELKTPLQTAQENTKEQLLPENLPGHASSLVNEVKEQNNSLGQLIRVNTDVLDFEIDSKYGDIVSAKLLKYPFSIEDKSTPFALLQQKPNNNYVAKSNLFAANGNNTKMLDFSFTSKQNEYQLAQNQKQLTVTLTGKNKDGLLVEKQFIVNKGSYLIEVRYVLQNQGSELWKGYFNTQLMRSEPKEDKSGFFQVGSYTGASYSNPLKKHFQKVPFSSMAKNNVNIDVDGGWIAMQQHYFLSAWIFDKQDKNKFYTRALNGDYTIGTVSQPIELHPNAQTVITTKLYTGPEDTGMLKNIAPYLDLTVDYGILWFLSSFIFTLMKTINNYVGNWGWSIVLVTLLIKLAFYRLSATSYKSMAGMRKLQPKLQALRERYGDDKAKISQATMELYKQEKINPLGGCLPIIVQIPVFIALYWVLLESVELRQAPFVFWISDLSVADPYHVLPLIMGATMLIQQKLNPAPPDPMQAKMMMFLPILFTGLFWSFPAGLVLYWIVNNTLSIVQQWYITRKYSDEKPTSKIRVTAK